MSNGYMGKVLWADLSKQTLWDEPLEEKLCRQYIGGHGLGAKILFDRQKAGVAPLGPDNILGFLTGTLTGTQALSASRYMVVGKSPLTDTWGDANSGGDFGPFLKFSGYDAVFIQGIADRPVYIFIDNGKAQIRDASHLWGKDTYETEDILKNELGQDVEVACIGQSGEKLSLIAAIINNKGRAAGRSGLGALMGSKKLKAVAVKGSLKPPLYDEAKISEMRKQYAAELGGPVAVLRSFGTPGILARCAASGDSPIKNWAGAVTVDFPQFEKIAANAVLERQEKRYGCYRCVVGCGGHMKAGTGEYQYAAGSHKPEYETLAMFGTNMLNDNLESIMMANDICNRYGLDSISAGGTIAYAMECYEKGLLTQKDTDGIDLTWGNHRSMIALLDKLARREGFGHILADGVKKAAERIGKGSEQYAMHIQGEEYAAHDPRRSYPFAVTYRLDPTPGRHTRDSNMGLAGLEKPPFDPNSFSGRAPAQKIGILYFHVADSAGCCHFVLGATGKAEVAINFINAATGWGMDMAEVLKTGERIANIRHCFNLREGLNVLEFKSPDRMVGKPPLTVGPTAGKTVDEEMIAREYCQAMDWDTKTARPSRQKLAELDMEDVSKVIWGQA
jgi:aldehyde:ferredoxin oxidoreductase